MKRIILYFTLIIGVILSCKKDDIKKQQFNPTGNALDNANYTLDSTNQARLDSIRNAEDSISHQLDSLNIIYLNIINNPTFGPYPGKINTLITNPNDVTYNFYYYNDGRIAKISSSGVAMSPMAFKSHLIFSYQPDGFTIKYYLKFYFNEDNPYSNIANLEYKTDANYFITNVKNKITYNNIDSVYDEIKISYINNKINKIEEFYNNVMEVPYYNNFLYDANSNLVFKSLNTPLFSYNSHIKIDSIFYTYSDFIDEVCFNTDINMRYIPIVLPVKYTGFRIPTSNKLAKTINYVQYNFQTDNSWNTYEAYDYEFNGSNKLIKIAKEIKNYDRNNILKDSSTDFIEFTYY